MAFPIVLIILMAAVLFFIVLVIRNAGFIRGIEGEQWTYKALKHFKKNGARFIRNCYLPRGTDDTTEVDLIMLYHSGIYVFESKNYSGWIFGNERNSMWIQMLATGKKGIRNTFYSPIKQNKTHIKALRRIVRNVRIPIYNIVVFSNRCVLKKVSVTSDDVVVCNLSEINKAVRRFNGRRLLSPSQIEELYSELSQYTKASVFKKMRHKRTVREQRTHNGISA